MLQIIITAISKTDRSVLFAMQISFGLAIVCTVQQDSPENIPRPYPKLLIVQSKPLPEYGTVLANVIIAAGFASCVPVVH